jgi:hypothetical protein
MVVEMDIGTMESIIIYAFITIFSFGLFSVSALSYNKSKNKKLLFISTVFLLFIIKGIILSLSLFLPELNMYITIPILAVFDLLVLFLLFIATLKK